VIFHCSLESWTPGRSPIHPFLPLALAGFATTVIFVVQWFVGLFPIAAKGSSNTNPPQKEHVDETYLSHPVAELFLRICAIVVLGAATLGTLPAHGTTEAAARVVKYSKEDIVPIRAKLRFSTLIVLPRTRRFSISPLVTKSSGSSTVRTTFATSIRRKPVFAAI